MIAITEANWLFSAITINRNVFPGWYVATGIVLVVSIFLSIATHLKKFGCIVLLTGAAMSASWEIILFAFGFRSYDNPLARVIGPVLELIYHSFSETGATILLGVIIVYKIGIIDLDKFKDEKWMILSNKVEQEAGQERGA
ncbi:MAG: hypothetical protein Q6373_014760 [Candidatus Sigynarchaeota archaeon]